MIRDAVTLLSERARLAPDRVACDFLDGFGRRLASFTYAELDRRAQQVAAALARRAEPGDRVVLAYPAGLGFVEGFFGVLYAGMIAVPVALPRGENSAEVDRLCATIADCACAVVLAPEETGRRLREIPALRAAVGDRWCAPPEGPAGELVRRAPDPDAIAFLQYTSGSTGAPKGVAVRHRNLLHNIARIAERCRLDVSSRALIWLPHFHDLGLIGGLLTPIFAGFPTSLMAPSSFMKRPLNWLRIISEGRYTISGGPNFAYGLCVERHDPAKLVGVDLQSWTCAFNGAEPILAQTVRAFGEAFRPYGFRDDAIYPCYGLAEGTLTAASNHGARPLHVLAVDAAHLAAAGAVRPPDGGVVRELVSSGQAAPEQVVAIVDKVGREVVDGQVGEIWTSDDSVAAGYWGRDEETTATFCARLPAHSERRFLRTGDLGVRVDGELFVVGRLNDLIIIDGRNLHPADIEHTVARELDLPVTRAVAAFGAEVSHDGREGLLILVEAEAGALEAAAISEQVRRAVANRHDVQSWAVVLVAPGSVPRTTSGKIRRADARDAYLRGELRTGIGEPGRLLRGAARGGDAQAGNIRKPDDSNVG